MRFLAIIALLALAAPIGFAAKRVTSPVTSASNDKIEVAATIYLQEQQIAQKIGADPGPDIALLEVRVTPKSDKPIQFSPDDFILLAHDDGERNKPFDPAEIAGQGALVVKSTPNGNQTSKKSSLGSFGPIGIGSPSTTLEKKDGTTSSMDTKNRGSDALLHALKSKQFPTTESADEVQGYLYFPLTGKHKLKNLIVLYRGPAGKLDLEFQH